MDSPNKSQLILVSDSQESPFYRYLCDLSPIKPARSVHVAQTYSELSLPPPPAVFTSPPPNSHRTSEATNETVFTQPSNGYAPVSRPDPGQSLGDRISAGRNPDGQDSVGQSLGGQSSADQSHGGQSSADQSYGGKSSADQSHGGQSSAGQCHGGQSSADPSHGCQHIADPSHGNATSVHGFVCSPSRPDPGDVELYLADLADAMTEESLQYSEVHHEKEHLQLAHSTSRVGVTGQRGVRRRCLDFEAAEARRKSMGNGVPRRCGAGSGSTEGASGVSYLASGASIPPQVLSERAGLQSDATNSSRSPSDDVDNQGPGRVDIQPSNEGMPSSLMRMSRCSSSKAKEEHLIEHSQSARDVMPSPVGIPSGIGLHLNSLAGSTVSFSPSRGFSCSMGMSTASLLGLTPMSTLKEDPAERSYNPAVSGGNLSVVSTTFASGGCVSVVEITREERQDINLADATVVGNLKATTCFRSVTVGVKPFQSRLPIEEGTEINGSQKRLMPPQELLRQNEVDLADELFESPRSPKKRRKSAAAADKSNEGCRRCNCKKSKCLKLYCECFAAGIYCVGSCTCQDCLNKPEYEEKVMETRHLIESRNPLAFAPKIVHGKDSSPTSDECTDTPASARHKRGCNCKKSLCLKKYCECFQAGVGCSEGCRCEGCQNMFGKKEAFAEEQEEHMSQDALDENELLETSLEGQQLLGGPIRSDRLRSGNKDWSPTTPSFPQPGQGRSSSRLRAAVKKRSCRDTPASPVAAKSGPKPPRSPVKLPRLTRAAANPRVSSSNGNGRGPGQYSRNMPSPVSTPKSRIATLSPRWDGLGDICTLTPLPQPPVRPNPASASTADRPGASPSLDGQCTELVSYSGPPVRGCEFTESCSPVFKHPDSQSPASRSASNCNHFQSPLHPQHTPASTHPTPPTPCLSSSQGTVGSKAAFSNPDMLPAYLSFDSAEDNDTPDFLKYSEAVQSPQILTKTSSPKQIKRVSPPHYDGLLKERGSRILSPGSGSPGLRNGRKFILQALPSFPSITPFSSLRGQFHSSG